MSSHVAGLGGWDEVPRGAWDDGENESIEGGPCSAAGGASRQQARAESAPSLDSQLLAAPECEHEQADGHSEAA